MKTAFVNFLRDEDGGYTIWGLTWFMIYLAIGGLAVDVTDAYRNQTLLQSTADTAALAGVLALPDENAAATAAVTNATSNMDQGVHGNVLVTGEVFVGSWDFNTRTFTEGAAVPNAVRVITRRSAQNNNAVAMNFLRILSLTGLNTTWDISTEAIAVGYTPDCVNDGMIAMNRLDLRSNNSHVNGICLHGQEQGVDLQNGNYFELGVQVSMPDLGMLPNRANLYSMNPGLQEALREGDMYPQDVNRVNDIIAGLRNLDPDYMPDFMVNIDPGTGQRRLKAGVTKITGNNLPATLQPDTVYDISCNGQEQLPGSVMNRVVVVADCRIQSSSGTTIIDGAVATSYIGNNASIKMAAQSTLGLADFCAAGGGVELYTPGDIDISAQGDWHGLRIVSGNDVKFTANNNGIYGMSVQAGNNIDYTSNNSFGGCSGGVPGAVALHYRLVH
ncbi:MAG: Tad domain-containing protein [Paracoccaceae bacterium]|nr:Tad domain-containing protein [Paracoccaceae bacterium]